MVAAITKAYPAAALAQTLYDKRTPLHMIMQGAPSAQEEEEEEEEEEDDDGGEEVVVVVMVAGAVIVRMAVAMIHHSTVFCMRWSAS